MYFNLFQKQVLCDIFGQVTEMINYKKIKAESKILCIVFYYIATLFHWEATSILQQIVDHIDS